MTMTMFVDADVSDDISLESSSFSDDIDNPNTQKQLNGPSIQDNENNYELDMLFEISADSDHGTNSELQNGPPYLHNSDVAMPINNEDCTFHNGRSTSKPN